MNLSSHLREGIHADYGLQWPLLSGLLEEGRSKLIPGGGGDVQGFCFALSAQVSRVLVSRNSQHWPDLLYQLLKLGHSFSHLS